MRAVLVLLAACCVLTLQSTKAQSTKAQSASVDYTTYGYSNARLGWNARETLLTPQTVRNESFGPRWKTKLDGGVSGATLVVNDLHIDGRKRRVVFTATERNTVYALDAQNGRVLWTTRELAAPVSEVEFRGWWSRKINGVLSTPVIDARGRTLYVCGPTRRGLRQQFMVWALDLQTGKIKANWPQIVRGSHRGKTFIAGEVMQRGALSLHNGWLLIPFGSRGDIPPWRGWIFGFNTRDPKAAPTAFCAAPQQDGGGFWSAGGLSVDERGLVYGVAANGASDVHAGGDHVGQSVIRLRLDARGLHFSKRTADFYTPANYEFLNGQDEGLGGASAMVLPTQDSSTPRLLFVGGKDGLGYLLNRDNLGGLGGELQKPRLFGLNSAVYRESIRATSAYFDGGVEGRFLFVTGDEAGERNKGLVALKISTSSTRTPQLEPIWTLPQVLERPSSPVVSSNGARNAVVWTVETRDDPGAVLRAYEALLGREIYNSDQESENHRLIAAARFVNPVVANGQVFVSTTEGVACYGLETPTNVAN